ncbi:hypothetical protein [Candidatus Avelusimicrobium luingense]|uniref:hypothetical protein n=1 Tax=Candidatus Avelusimicrobium luingense TaxID=3416211 RepID=UPI003D11E0BF
MKKLICILCLGLFLGACASNQRPSLYQIQKHAIATIKDLQEKEEKKTLTKEEEATLKELKDLEKDEGIQILLKYAERDINYVDVLTMGIASQFGYTEKEIDKFLNLGLYVKNPYCESEYKSYVVFQVLSDFVLANGCEITEYDKCKTINSKIFMYPKQKDELYFDKKILTPPSGTCSTYVGVFEYESKNEMNHVVPILVFIPKIIDKEQLENIQQSREESQKTTRK